MKKVIFIFFLILFSSNFVFSETNDDVQKVFSENNVYYGLKNSKDEIILEPEYRKIIKLGENAWIIQKKNQRFGLVDNAGNILVEPKYRNAERLFDKWVRLGNKKDFGIYDEKGTAIVPPEFSLIEPLFGHKFLTYKNYKYGVYSDEGELLLSNKYDFIYMPSPKTMKIKYKNVWYEFEKKSKDDNITITDDDFKSLEEKENLQFTDVVVNSGVGAGYGVVTATDYTLKIFSSISRAYEQTIDELTLSKGVEAVPVLMNFSWIPKFPFTFVRNYCENLVQPNNSPLSDIRNDMKEQMK